jgi:alpha-N-arabinofuranosidase
MRPQYYADLYRRYAVYCRNYGPNRLYKIACGPNSDDYDWTDKIMESITKDCSAISLHHYSWMTSQRATELSKDNYIKVIAKSRKMDELIERHGNIMAKYDPEHKLKLVVDEWGTWYKTEEGTNPRFLHQQSTMTDAIVAAGTLDIFNSWCNIVSMANIAQTVNVLQAVILTSGKQ